MNVYSFESLQSVDYTYFVWHSQIISQKLPWQQKYNVTVFEVLSVNSLSGATASMGGGVIDA